MSTQPLSSSFDLRYEINLQANDRSSGPPYFKIASIVALVVSGFFALALIPGAIGVMGYAAGTPTFTVVLLNVLTPAGVIILTLEGGVGLLGTLGSMVALIFAFSKKSSPVEVETPKYPKNTSYKKNHSLEEESILKKDKEEVQKYLKKTPSDRSRPEAKNESENHKSVSSSDESSTEEVSLRDDSNHYVYAALEKLKDKHGIVPCPVKFREDPQDMDVGDFFICYYREYSTPYVVHIQTDNFNGEERGVEYADFKTLKAAKAFIRYIKQSIPIEPFIDCADLKTKAQSIQAKQYRIFTKEGDDSNIFYVLFKVKGKLYFTTCDNEYESKCFIYHHSKTELKGRAIMYVSIHAEEDVSILSSLTL